MLNCKKSVGMFALLATMGLMVSAANGMRVTNVTDGTTLFFDDFESGTPNGSISGQSAVVGTWGTGNASYRNGANLASIPPYEGSQFMEFQDNGGPVEGLFDGGVANETGDLIRVEYAFQSDGGLWFFMGTYAENDAVYFIGNAQAGWGGQWEIPGSIGPFASVTQTFTPLTVWNTAVLEYVNGASTFTLSVNGQTAETITKTSPGIMTQFTLSDEVDALGDEGMYVLDAIPEPAGKRGSSGLGQPANVTSATLISLYLTNSGGSLDGGSPHLA